MTRSGFISAALVIAMATSATQHAHGQQPPPKRTSTAASQRAPSASQNDVTGFFTQMAIAGMAEVQLGKMASERAANNDVKAFGQMMVKDHTQANQELMQLASQMKIQLPTQLDQKHRDLADGLSKLQGAAFDREYLTAMVAGHGEVVNLLRMRAGTRLTSNTPTGGDRTGRGTTTSTATQNRASGTASAAVGSAGNAQGESALTEWASKTLPTVQHHLDEARSLQSRVK